MTTPYDPYASATSALPASTVNQIPGQIIGINSATINTSQINFTSDEGAMFGYSGAPANGNLYVAVVAQGGVDAFGNTYSTGINALAGNMQGLTLAGVSMDSTSTLTGTQLNQTTILNPGVTGGTAASLTHTMTNTGGGVIGYTSGNTTTTFSTNGTYFWTCPTGVTTIQVQAWGAGAGGGGGSSSEGGEAGGGGEYAAEPAFAVTPSNVYTITVGQGGLGGPTGNAGNDGGQTTFANSNGQGQGVIANGGESGFNGVGGDGGTGSGNTVHFDGGNGANASGQTGGAGAGGAAGLSALGVAAQGNAGTASTSSTGGGGGPGLGGAGLSGAGGAGGNSAVAGSNGATPGGGGGGAGADSTVSNNKTYQPLNGGGGTYSYYGANAIDYTPYTLRNHDGAWYSGQWENSSPQGYQYSTVVWPFTQIQSDLSGKTVTSVSLKVHNLHSWYDSGMYLEIQYVATGSFGNTFNYTLGGVGLTAVKTYWIDEGATLTEGLGLDGGIGVALQNGNMKSTFLGAGAINPFLDYYGYQDSGSNGGTLPELIVYYNSGGVVSGGNGSDGQVSLTYNSGTVPTFTLSVSASTNTDTFGNPYNLGFTGQQLTILGTQGPSTTPTALSNTSPSSGAIGASTAGNFLTTNSGGFTGQLPAYQVDTSVLTANGASSVGPSPITKQYIIPPNDAQVGTIYQIETPFVGQMEGNTVSWGFDFNGSGFEGQTGIGSAFFTAGTAYIGNIRARMQILTTGSSGTSTVTVDGGVGISANRSSGSNNNNAYLSGWITPVTINTTIANTVSIYARYSGTTAGQTCSGYGSIFQRIGP